MKVIDRPNFDFSPLRIEEIFITLKNYHNREDFYRQNNASAE